MLECLPYFFWEALFAPKPMLAYNNTRTDNNDDDDDDNDYTTTTMMKIIGFVFQMLNFFSDLCGVIGLWFGFAMMTFIEYFELIVEIVVLPIRKILQRCIAYPSNRCRINPEKWIEFIICQHYFHVQIDYITCQNRNCINCYFTFTIRFLYLDQR